MRSHTTTSPDRRARRIADRRSRRRPAIIAAGLAFGIFASAGMTVTAAASQPDASGQTASFALASFTGQSQVSATAADPASDRIAADTRRALADAGAAIVAASTVTADIQASGLDIGVPDTTVDTAELEVAVARLQAGAATLPAPLLPDLADDLAPLVAAIDGEVAGLRGSLDAATARKAAEEAAAQAQREAEAAAAAAAAQAASVSTASSSSPSYSSSGTSPVYAAGGTSAADAQAIAHSMIGGYGWGDDQFSCLVSLWNRESGWNVFAGNASGAYGIPQALPGSKMASAGADWESNPATQISWGLGYISGRYGAPCGAWDHSESTGWY